MAATSTIPVAKQSLNWSIAFSVLMIVSGILAIAMPPIAGLAVNVIVAWLLVFNGLAHFVFAWHTRTAGGMVWEVLLGLLYGFVGIYLLVHPLAGLASLTLALAIYLLIESAFEAALWYRLRVIRGAAWLLFDAAITFLLALLIWRTWPSSSEWAIGTLVGVSMLFSGISRLMLSLGAKNLLNKVA